MGHGQIVLDEVRCSGLEERLDQCQSNPWLIHDCTLDEAAGVECSYPSTSSPDNVRLADGTTFNSGRVEIYYDSSWGTICDDDWNQEGANVICRQLGFNGAQTLYSNAYFGPGSGPILNSLQCVGNEYQWSDCYFSDWDTSICSHYEDAGVSCRIETSTGSPDNVRLAGGSTFNSGRVEIYYDGSWGTICDDDWEQEGAYVICRQLGFAGAETLYADSYFGLGSGPILSTLQCVGNEYQWSDCYFSGWDTSLCTHFEDAGVTCRIEDYSLSAGAIIGIVIAVLIFISLCFVCCVTIYNLSKAQKNRGRNPPNVAVISASTNPAGPTAQYPAQPAIPPANRITQAPPAYNDVVSNPGYNPHIAFNTQQAHGHGTVVNANCPQYPSQSNPTFYTIQQPSMAYLPPSNDSVAYPVQGGLPPVQNPSHFYMYPPVAPSEITIQQGKSHSTEDSGIYEAMGNAQLPST